MSENVTMPRMLTNSPTANFKTIDLSEVIGTVLVADPETLLSGEIAHVFGGRSPQK